jgi:uncharacterized oligopeptide transporter (OPT) family protein
MLKYSQNSFSPKNEFSIHIKEVKLMDMLKTIWPTPFKIKEKDVTSFIIQLIILIVVCAVIGILIGVLAKIPVLGIIFGIIGSLVELYSLIGIILCIVKFLGVLKD